MSKIKLSLSPPVAPTPVEPVLPPATPDPALHPFGTAMEGFGSQLFVQAHTSEAHHAAPIIAHAGVGIVLTLTHQGHRSHLQTAGQAITAVRRGSGTADILLDRNRYSGKDRAPASSRMSLTWAKDQLQLLGLPWAMADPGFCSTPGDVAMVLQDAQPLPERVIVPLAIPHELLRDEAATLLDHVNGQDKPVALILQHEADPFSTPGVVMGLVHLLRGAKVPVALLRTDTSALGALCHGAAAAAVGAHSGLRHVYPIKDNGGGHGEHLSFVIPDLLTFVLATRFSAAYLQDPDLNSWRCACWFCNGRDLSWIDGDPNPRVAALQHSVAAIAGLGRQLEQTLRTLPPPQAWDLLVTTAQANHFAASNPSGAPWAPQDFLAHWHQVSGVPTLT